MYSNHLTQAPRAYDVHLINMARCINKDNNAGNKTLIFIWESLLKTKLSYRKTLSANKESGSYMQFHVEDNYFVNSEGG